MAAPTSSSQTADRYIVGVDLGGTNLVVGDQDLEVAKGLGLEAPEDLLEPAGWLYVVKMTERRISGKYATGRRQRDVSQKLV